MRKQLPPDSADATGNAQTTQIEKPSSARAAKRKPATPKVKGASARPPAGREKLVKAAAEVLADVGFEKLTSNAICARAGVTPPTFYHYFKDKYEVLEELAEQLLGKQNEQFEAWLADYASRQEAAPPLEMIERWFSSVAEFVSNQPGGIWTIRALRALPNLSHVRLSWQRRYTDQIFNVARSFTPESAWPLLWSRIRIVVEFSYVVDELVYEEDRITRETTIREAARMIHSLLKDIAVV
ncbi:TetR/AcrR family transcriptional regulator [Pseudomonas sp. NY15366]